MLIKTKSYLVRKIDPADDERVDTFWAQASLRVRTELATLDKHTLIKKIKEKLKRRCNCKDCRFSRISYYDPQARVIDAYIHQIESNACTCYRCHRDFSDDEHKDADYVDNPICQSYDTLLTSHIKIEGDKLQVAPCALCDDFFVKFREQREWRSLITTPSKTTSCEQCVSEENKENTIKNIPVEEKRDKVKDKEVNKKEEQKEEKRDRDLKKELMSAPEKEKKEPKEICDECRSRITFEMNVAQAIEERVRAVQRAEVLEEQSQAICEMLLREEEKKDDKKGKKQKKRTATNRAHHHHCSHHKPPVKETKESTKRRKSGSEKQQEEEAESMPSVVYPESNQVLILDSLNSATTESDEFDAEDWTVVGKLKKKPDSSPEPVLMDVVPELPKILRKPKSPQLKAEPQPNVTKQSSQKQPTWKGWKLPPSQPIAEIPQLPQCPPVLSIPPISVLPEIAQPSMPFHEVPMANEKLPKMDVAQFPNKENKCPCVNQYKVIHPPTPTVSARDVRDAAAVLVRAIKSLSLSPSFASSRPPPHLGELRSAVFDSLNSLSSECDALLLNETNCKIDQVCCEEECCLPSSNMCPLENEECNCTYYTNCFSLPMIIDSNIWQH